MVRALFAVAKVRRAWGYFAVSASSLTSKWVDEGEKMVRALFKVRRAWGYLAISSSSITSNLVEEREKMVLALDVSKVKGVGRGNLLSLPPVLRVNKIREVRILNCI